MIGRRDFGRRELGLAAAGLIAATPLARAAKPRTILAAVPIGRTDLTWWRHRHEAVLARLKKGPVNLLWIGDSITQNWEKDGPEPWAMYRPVWNRYYGDREAVNLGFIGDTTASVIWRIENGEVAGIAPKAAVLLIGANNLGRVHWGTEDTLAGIDAIIGQLHQRLPRTQILLLGILPSIRSAWATQVTGEVNKGLAERYGKGLGNVTYMDVGHLFMTGGKVDPSKFYDPKLTPPEPPLHPTAQTQAEIAAAIEPTLARMLGDRVHT
jgi:lysophospholipase L1-like esterase